MSSLKPTVEELHALQESLELQRRQVLALILELQDDGAAPEETEKSRVKLFIINQEMAQAAAQIIELKRRKHNMSFDTPKKMQVIDQVLQKTVAPAVKEAAQDRNAAETKLQILEARAAKFDAQKAELAGESERLNQEINRVLHGGGDPSGINRQVRTMAQESEDLATWAAQLRSGPIPEAQKVLTEAQSVLWRTLIEEVKKIRPTFDKELSDYLAQASELSDSWGAAVRKFFNEYKTGRETPGSTTGLIVDHKRTTFFRAT